MGEDRLRSLIDPFDDDPRNPELQEYARVGVARALRALGMPFTAVPLLEQAVG